MKKRLAKIRYWILKDGKNYFKQWTGIGPCATQKRGEAEKFTTQHEAKQSPAYTFSLTSYEPHPVRRGSLVATR